MTRVHSRVTWLRLLAGFAVLPFAMALVAFAGYLALWHIGVTGLYGGRVTDPLQTARSLAAGAAFLAFVVTICGVVPAVAWMMGRGPVTLRRLLSLGAGQGIAPFGLVVVGIVLVHLARGNAVLRCRPSVVRVGRRSPLDPHQCLLRSPWGGSLLGNRCARHIAGACG